MDKLQKVTESLPGKEDGTQWRDRIVGEGKEPPDQLLANPNNWRVHPRFQQDVLSSTLDQVGWIQRVIVNRSTGFIVDGHLRVTLAMRHGEKEIPVSYVELDEDEEMLILATLDPIAGLAVADDAKLREVMDQVQSDDAAIQAMMDKMAGEDVEDYSDLDEQLENLDGYQEKNIMITVPAMHEGAVMDWLANGESLTGPGMGKGVLRRCGLL